MMSSEAKITHDQRSTATLPTGVAPSLGSRPLLGRTSQDLSLHWSNTFRSAPLRHGRGVGPLSANLPLRSPASPLGVNHRITANTALQLAASAL